MIALHKLHPIIIKDFYKFSIKTLTKVACSNFKNEQKANLNPLGVELCTVSVHVQVELNILGTLGGHGMGGGDTPAYYRWTYYSLDFPAS